MGSTFQRLLKSGLAVEGPPQAMRLPCQHHESLDPSHGKGASKASPSLRSTSRRSMDQWMGSRPSADGLMRGMGFQHGRDAPILCVPVYPTGTHGEQVPLLLGFGQENFAWTRTLARPGQELTRKGAMIRFDWALGLAVHGWLAKWVFSLISSLTAQALDWSRGAISRDLGGFNPFSRQSPFPSR